MIDMIDRSDETILLVDDDDTVRRLMRRALEEQGYDILEATNGADALDVAAVYAAPIHLIVTDVRMPQLGGFGLLTRFRNWYPSIRCLLVSGYPESMKPIESLEGTPTSFLAKPFAVSELVGAVRELLDRAR